MNFVKNIQPFQPQDKNFPSFIFKNYPYLGVGSKNFRNECLKEIYYNDRLYLYKI